MSCIFVQKLNKVMERTRIIVRIVLFSSLSPQLTSPARHQPCDPWPHSHWGAAFLTQGCSIQVREHADLDCRRVTIYSFLFTNKYLFSIFYAPAIARSTRIHERRKIMGAVLTVLPAQSRSRIEQTAVPQSKIAGKAEEGQGAAGTTWSLQLFQYRRPSCFFSWDCLGASGNIYTVRRIVCGTQEVLNKCQLHILYNVI